MEIKAPESETNFREALDWLISFLRRHRILIIAVACIAALATDALLVQLPNRYTSQATLLVVQQQVPERYVTPTTSTSLVEALQAMKEEVLSRTRLLEIIEDFHLYVNERKTLPLEQLIDVMRRNIGIQPMNATPERSDFNAFKISFTAGDPLLAQQVTSRLTSLFIQENLRTREDQAANTTSFLSDQLKDVAKRLADSEQRLRDYKMQHLGELPEQEDGNVAILSGLQSQLQNTEASLSRAQQQRAYLESLRNDYRQRSARGDITASLLEGRPLTPLQAASNELTRLQSVRNNLLSRYTPEHPDVKRADADVARQQQVVDDLRKAGAAADSAKGSSSESADAGEDASLAQIKSQLEANRLEIEGLSSDEKRIKAAAANYQSRLDSTPVREQQLAAVNRDYDLLKKEYADLLSKQQQSQLATSLEKQQEGQQFRLVDPPNLPSTPSSPNRRKISLGGLIGGVCLGLALAFLKEMRKPSFHAEAELQKRFGVPVVGVPVLSTPGERRNQSWRNTIEWTAASVLVMTVLSAEFFVYRWS